MRREGRGEVFSYTIEDEIRKDKGKPGACVFQVLFYLDGRALCCLVRKADG